MFRVKPDEIRPLSYRDCAFDAGTRLTTRGSTLARRRDSPSAPSPCPLMRELAPPGHFGGAFSCGPKGIFRLAVRCSRHRAWKADRLFRELIRRLPNKADRRRGLLGSFQTALHQPADSFRERRLILLARRPGLDPCPHLGRRDARRSPAPACRSRSRSVAL
jgi:hypothetical protein